MPQALPTSIREWLATPAMREHHSVWHYVRAFWPRLSPAEQAGYAAQGYRPPRLNPAGGSPEPGAGTDFLFMHRKMIEQVNDKLRQLADPSFPRVAGWSPIPWNHADPEWPMPPMYPQGSAIAKDATETARWRTRVGERYENEAWLRATTLDALGTEIENGIHNWLHMHWAADPWFKGSTGQSRDDPRNDYLGSTYSSHVNPAFWKLHGWIDDRIGQWERATGKTADWTGAWAGPAHHDHGLNPLDKPRLITKDLLDAADNFFARAIERNR